MDKNQHKMPVFIWFVFLQTIILFGVVLALLNGGLSQIGDLDYDRMVLLNDPTAQSFYLIACLIFAAHKFAPGLVKGANTEFVGHIVKWTMLETIALLGFVLGKSLQDTQAAFPFFFLSLIGLAMAFPKKKRSFRAPGTPIT